ncbi:MAG: nickel/cobalt transporter [Burkholderiaceae bacterium]|nr:nickel/cobalt transporter [Burkholderiaceae bacterium]MCD8536538.1 nickel/cobalt transporter [Burkholderiaceae bacterium]MCD8565341.1 nickel/cobalt transporter [Burkholderiaceae bacterium]
MSRPREDLIAFLLGGLLLLISATALAQSPHPFAVPEQRLPTPASGWFTQWTGQIAIWQSEFYRELTGAVRAWKSDGWQAWGLLGLSFAYGVFHALGPGHGKAILSAYVLANRETVRNGAILAFVSALIQALVAIVMVGIAAGILNVTGAVLNEVTALLELGAYALLTALGAWLVYKHIIKPVLAWLAKSREHDHSHSHHHGHNHHHHDHAHHDACGCGHVHMPDPAQISGKLNWRKAWGAIVAIGLRPCSGAILVLVFALSQQFFVAGVAAALAMGLGTGLTVAVLAMMSLTAGRMAEAAGGSQGRQWGQAIGATLQGAASIAVLIFGVLLFSAAWQYGALN